MLEQLKMLRAKRAFPRKQALAIQPTEIFFDKRKKKAYFRLKGPKISWRLSSIIYCISNFPFVHFLRLKFLQHITTSK